jgi:hypothetical protein
MPEEYTPPTGGDIYRCFSIPVEMRGDRYVSAVDVRPGNRKICASRGLAISIRMAPPRALDAADPGRATPVSADLDSARPGYLVRGRQALGQSTKGRESGSSCKRMRGSSCSCTITRCGQPEKDKTQIGLYFARATGEKGAKLSPTGEYYVLDPCGRGALPGHQVAYNSPFATFDTHIVSIAPHMHLVGREIGIEIAQPNSQPACLVRIDDWDFNWQSFLSRQDADRCTWRHDPEAELHTTTIRTSNPAQPQFAPRRRSDTARRLRTRCAWGLLDSLLTARFFCSPRPRSRVSRSTPTATWSSMGVDSSRSRHRDQWTSRA